MNESAEGTRKPSTTQLAALRTYLAADRTFLAVLRTGLSISGGGSLVITLLGDAWPKWVQIPLVAVFLIIGYSIALLGLRRYRQVERAAHHRRDPDARFTSSAVMTAITVALHLVMTIVVVLFLMEVR